MLKKTFNGSIGNYVLGHGGQQLIFGLEKSNIKIL
jgi:hypothetical protein